MSFIDHLGPNVLRDLANTFCGEKLGGGAFRKVYVLRTDETKVVKIEAAARSFNNIIEWQTWIDLQHDRRRAKWLAPCWHISPCGAILIQDRTSLIRKEELPKRIPEFLVSDSHEKNWGLLNGRPVCHDYGCQRVTFPLKPVKPKWGEA